MKSQNIYEKIHELEILLVYTSEPDLMRVLFDEKVTLKFNAQVFFFHIWCKVIKTKKIKALIGPQLLFFYSFFE